ncbi:MAG: hypothetical protein ACOYU0_04620 [Nitrospirota bacterium]
MIFLTLEKKLSKFLNALSREFRLVVPEKKGEKTYTFSHYSSFDKVALEFLRTILPPKKFFFLPKESLFNIGNDFNINFCSIDNADYILFGLHPCDLHGIDILGRAFSYKGRDSFYWQRREKIGIIGFSCLPDRYCLCKSMHTDFIESVYDIFLYTLDNVYTVTVRTALGDDMVRLKPELFKECTEMDIAEYKERIKIRDSKFIRIVDITNLAELLTLEYKSEIWEEYSKKCLFCGSCVIVCPIWR